MRAWAQESSLETSTMFTFYVSESRKSMNYNYKCTQDAIRASKNYSQEEFLLTNTAASSLTKLNENLSVTNSQVIHVMHACILILCDFN